MTIRQRWHIHRCHTLGKRAVRNLKHIARHAEQIGDDITVARAYAVIICIANVGWTPRSFDNGRIIPNRTVGPVVSEPQEVMH